MAEQRNPSNSDPQKDREERPAPGIDPVEGDEETVDEALREQERKRKAS